MPKKRNREEWFLIYQAFLNDLPECACGCGEKTDPTCKTLDHFISQRGTRSFYKYKRIHDPNIYHQDVKLSVKEKSLLVGTLLGDAFLGYPNKKSRFPRLSFNHSVKQKEWAEYKMAKLSNLGMKGRIAENGGFGDFNFLANSFCIPALIEIHDLMYKDRKAVVTSEALSLLDDEGLAWWYCDDGSTTSGTIATLHTESYTLEENHLVLDFLNERFGHAEIKETKRKYHYIYMKREGAEKFFQAIAPFVPECMEYKVGNFAK